VHKVGFISPPGWFDITPMEFQRIAPPNTYVMQTVLRSPGFDYRRDDFVAAVYELAACFNLLADAGAGIIAQFGFPFALMHGWEKASKLPPKIQGERRAQLVMMGVEVVYAMQHLGCKSVAVAATYYSTEMAGILQSYLAEAGLKVMQADTWQTQGMADEKPDSLFAGEGQLDPMAWQTPLAAVEKAVLNVAESAPEADCILVSGGGMRLLDIVVGLEKQTGKPIVAGDLALYWGILRRLGVKQGVANQGKLLAGPG
jgi:maleate cis-trans isomerase